jgi:CheY-like chemotaxis protein
MAELNRDHTPPLRLLVVDDDPLSTAFQAHLASLLGHRATVLNDPVKALAAARDGDFDVVLLDLGMPTMDGFDVVQQLRAGEAAAGRTPRAVIAVTGYASEADRQRCLAAGFTEHLSKPIQASTLGAALERAARARTETAQVAAAVATDAAAQATTDAGRLRAAVQKLGDTHAEGRLFAPTVTESFALRSVQLIETLRTAATRHDREQTARAARALRSSAEFLGALRLAQMCADYEDGAQQGQWDALAQQLQAIDHEHQAVLTVLFESAP